MSNKSISGPHEQRTAKFWREKLGYPYTEPRKDNKHMHDLKGGPFPIECKKRVRWDVQQWAREMEAAHGSKWALHVEVRNIRLKDAPPKVIMISEDALVHLKTQWQARSNMTPQEWFQYGVKHGYLEVNP